MVATMPIGAVLGSLFSNPSSLGFVIVTMMGLIAISGILSTTPFPRIGSSERSA
jgi:predicted MFS family arabinose efflux permease